VEVYSLSELARAAAVPDADVVAAFGAAGPPVFVPHDEAVRIGRSLAARLNRETVAAPGPMFSSMGAAGAERHPVIGLAVSGSVHAVIAAFVLVAGFTIAPRAASLSDPDHSEPMRLVFLATPGPGGGGGGGGLQQKAPAPKAMREGTHRISSPVPLRQKPKPIESVPSPVEPKPEPPLKSEQLPVVVAPIVTAPADPRTRTGVLDQTTASTDSHGSGQGGGAGSGTGTGLGSGEGSGVGPGSGGGTGGGPYRPGSGIQPPRLLREVKADYTEEARQKNIGGEVVMEIVVRRDGSVGDVRVLRGLPAGLNDRAIQAVRQWKFAPAQRLGTPVDVLVEVAVEFKLR
jgi:periplasmic protein TonB